MPYAYATLANVRQQLAQRLYDTGSNLFWSDAEKDQIIKDALRTWNSHTSFWRREFTFPTIINTSWYDLTTQANSLRPVTLTDTDLLQQIENHLLEPLTGGYPLVWAGSAQFSTSDILNALQRRRDEVISATSCVITRSLVAAVPGRIFLPDTTVDIRRMAWIPAVGLGYENTPMWPTDQWALQSFQTDFTTQPPDIPATYRMSAEPPLSFNADVDPIVPGQYEVLSVNNGPTLSDLFATALGIPDDFFWVIKWGALADLLGRESNAKDSMRAQYCEMRYAQGVSLLLNSPALLNARILNLPLDICAVQGMDDFRSGWQAETAAQPDTMMVAGLNLVALAPKPDAIYQVSVTVVENAPIPNASNVAIQVGRDDLEAIIDYAQHVASFKMGGSEFMTTIPLLQRFIKRASMYNLKLNQLGEFTRPIYEQSQLQAASNPVYTTADPVADKV